MQPDMIASAVHALQLLLEPARLLILFVGVMIGLAIGVLPGLNGIVGMAMLIPFTYNLDEYTAFALLLGMAAVITSSDFITAVLFGVPGHVGAAATVIDGHAMARKGEAGRAFGAGFAASLAGGIVGAVGRRFCSWMAAFIALVALIGFIPAIAVFVCAYMRFGFGEPWPTALGFAAATTLVCYVVFHWALAVAWPPSLLGELFPNLRAATRLF